tara:strand:+ start:4646 stop:6055 length:1410 start_codon:yes stop_codon:yes gene_type:complete
MNDNLSNIKPLFESQKEISFSFAKSTYKERNQKLKSLLKNFINMEEEAIQALSDDLGKSPTESVVSEILGVRTEIDFAVKNLKRWMRSKRVPTPLTIFFTAGWIRPEPKGRVLILAPWNYPILLCLNPLIAAIAAGNSVIIKPSEFTPASGLFIKKLINKTFTQGEVSVVLGNQDAAIELLKNPFNHIFFTGSPATGKLVMAAAAKQLSSVTLELGGKSPVIVDKSASLSDTAWKLAFYKFANAGQTCTAPDYILCHESKKTELINKLKTNFNLFFSENANVQSPDYCQIINSSNFDRLNGYLNDAVDRGATVEFGGNINKEKGFISPTILSDVSLNSDIMKEEIFGPIFPIISYKKLSEAVSFINEREKPLALYFFGNNKSAQRDLVEQTSSGAIVFNDCVIHHTNPNLPFGGVNNSGIGKYHGKYGFDEFSNIKAIMKSGLWSPFKLMIPPYTNKKHFLVNMIKRLS